MKKPCLAGLFAICRPEKRALNVHEAPNVRGEKDTMTIKRKTPTISAKEAAVRYLSRSDHAEQALRQKLLQRGYAEQDADEAIAYCQDYNWLDDARYAATVRRNGIAKGWGALRIQQEMTQKGVHEWLIRQQFEDDTFDWFEHARAVAVRKFGENVAETASMPQKEQARRCRFLQSRGFEFEQIQYALNIEDDYL